MLLLLPLVALSFLLALLFFIQVMAAALSTATKKTVQPAAAESLQQAVAFLVPAHNEEAVIANTLVSLQHQLRPQDEIVVVADNCTDQTAAIARQHQVTVLERVDASNKGKGFALAFGADYIKTKSVDVVIMVDADCILEGDVRNQLVSETLRTQRPVQALYLMQNAAANASAKKKFSEFTWLIKNKIRPLGLRFLNGPCQLTGSGMAFPITLFEQLDLASGCIVEDMKMGLDLAAAGYAPILLDAALVLSYFPEEDTARSGQRSRWIHGHLEMIKSYVPKLLSIAAKKRDGNALFMALDLVIPPLVMLFVFNAVVFILALFYSVFFGSSLWAWALLAGVLSSVALLCAWCIGGRQILSVGELWSSCAGALANFSLYTRFFTSKRTEWNKTSRK